MSAIVVARIHVTDPDKYESYKPLSKQAIEDFGGRYLVRGATPTTLEGKSDDVRYVVLEFESVEAATRFYDSPGYLRARKAREGASDTVIDVVEGV